MTFQDTLFAFLSDTYVGRFSCSSRGTVSFAYDDDYRWSNDPTPLSLDMPLEEKGFDDERPAIFLEALVPESPRPGPMRRDCIMRLRPAPLICSRPSGWIRRARCA